MKHHLTWLQQETLEGVDVNLPQAPGCDSGEIPPPVSSKGLLIEEGDKRKTLQRDKEVRRFVLKIISFLAEKVTDSTRRRHHILEHK